MQDTRLNHPFTIRFLEYSRINLQILGVLVLSAITCASSAWAASPYPQSSVISSVVWDFGGKVKAGQGSDLWPVTWGANGNTYTAFGDGGGPHGTNTVCRTHFGLAQMVGSPPNYTFRDIWGCKSDGTGCDTGATHDAACDAPYGGELATFGVPASLLHVDNVLHAIVGQWSTTVTVKDLQSSNYGQSWSDPGVSFNIVTGAFLPGSYLNYGAGYSGGDSKYVYLYGQKYETANATYLARIPRASFNNLATWQYFTGTFASPSWGAWGSATPVFVGEGGVGSVQYFPVIGKYIVVAARNEVQQFGMYESANPWGPWYTIYYGNTWGNYGLSAPEGDTIVPSSLSSDNKTFYLTFSGDATPDNWDNYNLIKGTFVLQSTTTAGVPMAPASLSIK